MRASGDERLEHASGRLCQQDAGDDLAGTGRDLSGGRQDLAGSRRSGRGVLVVRGMASGKRGDSGADEDGSSWETG